MNIRLTTVAFLAVIVFGCTNKQNKAGSTTVQVEDQMDKDFDSFIDSFNKDFLFQISRIDFPLKVQEADWQKDYALSERIINRSDYRRLDLSRKSSGQTNNYTLETKVDDSKATIEMRGIENGIMVDFFFEKKHGQWRLVTWIDSST